MILRAAKHCAGQCIVRFLSVLPVAYLEALITKVIQRRTKDLKPSDGLRFLFRLDEVLYALEGTLSIAYGGGIHTKHRQTGYHHFFVNRIRQGERVIDLGCGSGSVAYQVAEESGASVVGIDLDPDNVAQAKTRFSHERLVFLVGDILKGIEGGQFDVVIMSNVLEHLPNRIAFLKNVLVSTGCSRILIRVPLFERDWRVPLRRELGVEWRLDSTHETEYTLESFKKEMGDTGLIVSDLEVRWGEIWAEVSKTAD